MPMGACTLKDPESRLLAKPALKSDTELKAGILSSASGTKCLFSWGRGYGHELSASQYKKYVYVDDASFFLHIHTYPG